MLVGYNAMGGIGMKEYDHRKREHKKSKNVGENDPVVIRSRNRQQCDKLHLLALLDHADEDSDE